jgi:hypothetical protein
MYLYYKTMNDIRSDYKTCATCRCVCAQGTAHLEATRLVVGSELLKAAFGCFSYSREEWSKIEFNRYVYEY